MSSEEPKMNPPIQTNLDDICLEEIQIDEKGDKTATMKSNQSSRIIHCSDGSIEVDENDNCLKFVKVNDKTVTRPKRLKLFQLISSPHISNIGKKTLKTVDFLGGNVIKIIGITDPKYSSEIGRSKQRGN